MTPAVPRGHTGEPPEGRRFAAVPGRPTVPFRADFGLPGVAAWAMPGTGRCFETVRMTGGITLSGEPAGRWTLDHGGHRLEVETGRDGWNRFARLYVDGEPAAETTTDALKATLTHGEASVAVAFDVLGLLDGQAARCDLAPPAPGKTEDGGAGGAKAASQPSEPFEPPGGTRAARREALARAHPVLYASRHVAVAAGKMLLPVLGLGALIQVLLGAVPLPDVRLPDIDAPSLPWPDIPWPDLPDVSAPPWLAAVLAAAKFWIPLLIAVGVAVREARRRKRAAAARDADREPAP